MNKCLGCGAVLQTEDNNKEGYTNGVFTLCTLLSEVVTEGQKAYMLCDKCGNYSHL